MQQHRNDMDLNSCQQCEPDKGDACVGHITLQQTVGLSLCLLQQNWRLMVFSCVVRLDTVVVSCGAGRIKLWAVRDVPEPLVHLVTDL